MFVGRKWKKNHPLFLRNKYPSTFLEIHFVSPFKEILGYFCFYEMKKKKNSSPNLFLIKKIKISSNNKIHARSYSTSPHKDQMGHHPLKQIINMITQSEMHCSRHTSYGRRYLTQLSLLSVMLAASGSVAKLNSAHGVTRPFAAQAVMYILHKQ